LLSDKRTKYVCEELFEGVNNSINRVVVVFSARVSIKTFSSCTRKCGPKLKLRMHFQVE